MDHHAVALLGVTPDDFFDWLSELKTLAEEEQQRNPYRPQCPPLQVLRVDPNHIPLIGRREGCIFQGLYVAPPGPSAPFGHPAATFSLLPQPADRLCAALGYLLPQFPLEATEIIWLLEQRFPHVPRLHACFLGHQVNLDRLQDVTAACAYGEAGRVGQSERTGGAPTLACNLWLRSQMELLPDLRKNRHLYKEWIRRYSEERGFTPHDSRKSFRESVRARIREIQRRRSNGREGG